MRKLRVSLTIVLITLTLFAGAARAKSTVDLTTAGVGARQIGMGQAYVSIAEGADALFLNPAGIASAKSWGLTSMSTKLLDRVDYKMLGGVYATEYGVFGVGYIGANTPAGYLTTDKNSLSGAAPISYGSNLLVLSYGKQLAGGLKNAALGVNLKLISNSFSGVDASGSGMDLDIGVMTQPNEKIRLGAVVKNILPSDMGGVVAWKSNAKESVPSVLKFGGSYQALPNLLVATDFDYALSGEQPLLAHAGVEWRPLPILALRGGLDQNPISKNDAVTDFSVGIGIDYKGIRFDYAFKNNSLVENSNAHYISLSFAADQFNKKEPVPLLEGANKPSAKPGEPVFATEAERSEYLYKVATGQIKPQTAVAQAPVKKEATKAEIVSQNERNKAIYDLAVKNAEAAKKENQTNSLKTDKIALK